MKIHVKGPRKWPPTSPLLPMKTILSIGRIATGCPMRPIDPECSIFAYSPMAYCGLIFGICLNLVILTVASAVIASAIDLSITDYFMVGVESMNLSSSDASAVVALIFLSVGLSVAYIFMVRGVHMVATKYCQMAMKASNGLEIEAVDYKNLFRRQVLKLLGLGVIIAGAIAFIQELSLSSLFNNHDKNISSTLFYAVLIVNVMSYTALNWSPFTFVAHAFMHQVMGSLNLLLVKFAGKLENADNLKASEVIATGNELVELAAYVNRALSTVIIIEVSLCILIVVIAIYFGISILNAFQGEEIDYTALKFGASNLLFGGFFYFRRWFLICAGQKLCNSFALVRIRLQKFWAKNAQDEKENVSFAILMDQFSQTPIRPRDIFDLRQASGMSMDGLIVTYLIVLLQFKFA